VIRARFTRQVYFVASPKINLQKSLFTQTPTLIIIPDTNVNAPLSLLNPHPMIPNIPKLFPPPYAPKLLNQTQSPSQASAPAIQSACASYADPPHPQGSDANDISSTDRPYPVTLTLRDYSDNIPVSRARRWVKGVISAAEWLAGGRQRHFGGGGSI
jgi:hypothetical protein